MSKEKDREEIGVDLSTAAAIARAFSQSVATYRFALAMELLAEVAEAAVAYAESEHTFDSNCSAGDCDSCSARDALKNLEKLIGGPRHTPAESDGVPFNPRGRKVVIK